MTYVVCEVLAWRGIWLSEERRRIGNVEVGRAVYLGIPYCGRWLLAVARILVEKHHIGLGEFGERMLDVHERYADRLSGKSLDARPRSIGDGADVPRNSHHEYAVGTGDPQIYAGRAGRPRFAVGQHVLVRDLPVLLCTRTPEYVRGAVGEIDTVAYESPAPEDETWGREDATPEWFYVVRFDVADCGTDTPVRRRTPCAPRSPGVGSPSPNRKDRPRDR